MGNEQPYYDSQHTSFLGTQFSPWLMPTLRFVVCFTFPLNIIWTLAPCLPINAFWLVHSSTLHRFQRCSIFHANKIHLGLYSSYTPSDVVHRLARAPSLMHTPLLTTWLVHLSLVQMGCIDLFSLLSWWRSCCSPLCIISYCRTDDLDSCLRFSFLLP